MNPSVIAALVWSRCASVTATIQTPDAQNNKSDFFKTRFQSTSKQILVHFDLSLHAVLN